MTKGALPITLACMIGKLKGTIEQFDDDGIILDVGGVGYVVYLSAKSRDALGGIGSPVSLLIDTNVREDHIHLYGFVLLQEQSCFRLLCTVQGVGTKMALAIMSAFAPAEIAQAIAAKDTKLLTRASGVGPKLAERIVVELKTKAAKIAGGFVIPAVVTPAGKGKPSGAPLQADDGEAAISALVNLGYGRSEAFTAISLVRQKNPEATLEALIKGGLQELAR